MSVEKRHGDPEEEKIRDYTKQRRNAWGENDKSSRKAIRLRKAWVNRSYRRAVRQAVDAVHEHDDVTDAAQKIRRKEWKKGADLPLLCTSSSNSIWGRGDMGQEGFARGDRMAGWAATIQHQAASGHWRSNV